MRTLTNGNLTVVCFDANVYKQERNTLQCTVTDTQAHINLTTIRIKNGNTTLATYHVAANGKLAIDLTDYIRVNASGTLTVQAIYDLADITGAVSVGWSVVGLISPARLFVPDTNEAAEIRSSAGVANNWLLPTRIVQPTTSADVLEVYGCQNAYLLKSTGGLHPHLYYCRLEGGYSQASSCENVVQFIIGVYYNVYGLTRTDEQIAEYLYCEANVFTYDFKDAMQTSQADAEAKQTAIQEYYTQQLPPVDLSDVFVEDDGNADTTEKKVTGTTFDSLTIGSTAKSVGVTNASKEIVQSVQVQPRRCGVIYAAVEWVSATGHTRRATWEVREHKQQTGEQVAIETVTNDYDVRKGREDALTLRLDGLTAFDVWYYGDIVSSSQVRLSLDGGSTWQQVKVESEDVTVPNGDGGELQELKINVTYAEYDAVVM